MVAAGSARRASRAWPLAGRVISAAMAPLSDADIESRLASLAGWERGDGDTPAITREWKLADFAAALAFVNRVGEAAEAADHHPDILLHSWNRVRLTLST